jgi:organic radical activating enzyme
VRVKEVFRTIQGEGANAGTPAIFIRFGGCNLWNGNDVDRKRDADRHGVKCPMWCDTDFADAAETSMDAVIDDVRECGGATIRLIVLTGGEPTLQITPKFLDKLKRSTKGASIAIETNGLKQPAMDTLELIDWVCVSPKTPADQLQIVSGNELKIVYPAYNPRDYLELVPSFGHVWVSPQASPGRRSVVNEDNMERAARFVMENPRWKLSLQTHKIIGLP